MNMFSMFDGIPKTTLKDNKETKRYGRTDAHTHGQRENSTDRGITSTCLSQDVKIKKVQTVSNFYRKWSAFSVILILSPLIN